MREMFSIFSDRYHPLMKFENIDVITRNDKEIFEIFSAGHDLQNIYTIFGGSETLCLWRLEIGDSQSQLAKYLQ